MRCHVCPTSLLPHTSHTSHTSHRVGGVLGAIQGPAAGGRLRVHRRLRRHREDEDGLLRIQEVRGGEGRGNGGVKCKCKCWEREGLEAGQGPCFLVLRRKQRSNQRFWLCSAVWSAVPSLPLNLRCLSYSMCVL